MSPASSDLHIKHTHTSKHFVIFVGISVLINVHRLFLSYLCLCRLVVSCHLQLRIHITLQFPPSLITLPLFLILFLTIFLVSLLEKNYNHNYLLSLSWYVLYGSTISLFFILYSIVFSILFLSLFYFFIIIIVIMIIILA